MVVRCRQVTANQKANLCYFGLSQQTSLFDIPPSVSNTLLSTVAFWFIHVLEEVTSPAARHCVLFGVLSSAELGNDVVNR